MEISQEMSHGLKQRCSIRTATANNIATFKEAHSIVKGELGKNSPTDRDQGKLDCFGLYTIDTENCSLRTCSQGVCSLFWFSYLK